MSRKKPTKESRKKQTKPIQPEQDLRAKLKAKLHEKQLERTSQFSRDNKMDELEERLEQVVSSTEKKKIKEEMALIEKVEDKIYKSINDEYPEYGDNASYGGSWERPD